MDIYSESNNFVVLAELYEGNKLVISEEYDVKLTVGSVYQLSGDGKPNRRIKITDRINTSWYEYETIE